MKAGLLVPLLEDCSSIPPDTHAVWPTAQHIPLRLRVALDALADRVPKMVAL